MSVTPLAAAPRRADALAEARIHLAAAYRLATLDDLEEGIDNHLTMSVPGRDDQYLILPFGLHWSEARASDLVVYGEDGRTLEGTGVVERSAHCIHTPIHRITGANGGAAHPPDLGPDAEHARGQPPPAHQPDGGLLPRPDRLRRHLHRRRRHAGGRRAAGAADGRPSRSSS